MAIDSIVFNLAVNLMSNLRVAEQQAKALGDRLQQIDGTPDEVSPDLKARVEKAETSAAAALHNAEQFYEGLVGA